LTQEEENQLLEGCRRGDPSCWEHLYQSFRPDVARMLLRIIGACNELEDLVQTVFLRVYRGLDRFEGRSRFATWLYGICSYVSMEYIRKKKRRREVQNEKATDNVADPGADPYTLMIGKKTMILLQQSLEKIKEKKRKVLILHDIMGVPAGEIAQMLNVSTATVRSRLFHARREVAQKMAKLAGGGTLG
jgi:RNA polymerase sigma-70 factor, ECF subfamily